MCQIPSGNFVSSGRVKFERIQFCTECIYILAQYVREAAWGDFQILLPLVAVLQHLANTVCNI